MASSGCLCRQCDCRTPQGRRGNRNKKLIDVLIWNLDWGGSYERIVKAAKSAGVSLSLLPCVVTRPELAAHLSFESSAFLNLSSDRFIGMDRGPIQWSSIDRYCQRYGLFGEEFDRFVRIIRALDEAYLGYKKEGV